MDFIIKPIAALLGKIMDYLFMGLNAIGLGNIAIAIILFTLLVKLLMLPLTMKQTKMTKLNGLITPEVKAIQEKYKDKRDDQNAMMKMNDEIKAVYERYGTSQFGGCTQLLIQMPILFALYRVFQYIPLYITNMKDKFIAILGDASNSGISKAEGYAEIMAENFKNSNVSDWNNMDQVITAMNSFTSEQWTKLGELFPDFATTITENCNALTEMNTIFGINVSQLPVLGLNITIIIPILAGLSQFISVKITQARSGGAMDDEDNPAAASMKMMTMFMPIMSTFIAFSCPAGLGLYWIATAVFQTILHIIIDVYYDKIGTDEIVRRNIEKRNKKRAKQGLPPEKIAKNATASTKKIDSIEKGKQRIADLEAKKAENDKKMKEILDSTKYYKSAKPGSLAEKAGMVAKYNEKNAKKGEK
ncbi:MAG: YidC/Oxa1 family membrane protein insertase [Lachnospira sp.]|nr:YidC/Oxa1 family membrane protein insertase [Lachnospira sp.]